MAPPVVCLGEALIDRIFERCDGQTPQAPFWVDHPGGALANVATALTKLGTPAALMTCLGRDAQGHQVEAVLQEVGVNLLGVQWTETHPTRVVLVHRDGEGDRTFVGFSLPDPTAFADAHLDAAQMDWSGFDSVQYLVMGTLGLAYAATGQSMQVARTWARQNGVTTVVDLNWRPVFWPQPHQAPPIIQSFVAGVDILKLNREEAHHLFQTTEATALRDRISAQLVLLTDGANGCHYATASHQGHVPAYGVDCEDSTGAGDSFLAGFLHQLEVKGLSLLDQDDTLREAVQYANAAGALTATQPGAMTAQPNGRAVEAFLYLHNQLMT